MSAASPLGDETLIRSDTESQMLLRLEIMESTASTDFLVK